MTAYFAEAPVALVIGCGGMGTSVARALGKRHPLMIADIDGERLAETIDALTVEGYVAAGQQCDITDAAQVRALGEVLAKGSGARALVHVAAVGKSIGKLGVMSAKNTAVNLIILCTLLSFVLYRRANLKREGRRPAGGLAGPVG